ncbi:homoserine kinase [Mangrovibacillus cuniculi]|uniref:Homoserine kinase n=1 Tax=Mangrovibacillus cuniculi TaxID=2593652 RepID=A0A7S8CAV2_9BACI|nr:homoserine kinase [Mangrovibacillus cuniculi]QPC46423.1 homoserine kinase [Mangrovibacillus cuniculi]
MKKKLTIQVPASSANLGPGFDSVGIALGKYLTLEVQKYSRWHVVAESPHLAHLPNDEEHFIVQTALKIAERYEVELPPCRISIRSDIPLAKGLGTSSSALLAGLELANQMCQLNLTLEEKIQISSELEGHPDNVGPALTGGLFIGAFVQGKVNYTRLDPPNIDFVVAIPPFELLTDDSRNALPSHFPFVTSIEGSALANVLVAALATNNLPALQSVFSSDVFHEPFRQSFIPHWLDLKHSFLSNGALGVALSGGGPSILVITEKGQGESIATTVQKYFPLYEIRCLPVDIQGVVIK